MKILLIGSGGREHALAWKLLQSPPIERLFVAPGNGGTATLPKTENIALAATDLPGLMAFAQHNGIDLTVVGPEAPLVAGLTDRFQAAGLRIFGPTGAAAQLEGSKAFSKAFLLRHGIPTAQAAVFRDHAAACRHLATLPTPPVIKASGLAAGKGVIVPQSHAEAAQAIDALLRARRFGAAGDTILLEERLTGPELSVLAFCDGKTTALLPAAQDHKRLLDGDRGPNTGGMGAFAPPPPATPALLADIDTRVLRPTLAGMAAEGAPYVGVLYAGLMLTPDGPKVLEFNCRLGDPETQVLLPLLASDLIEVLTACLAGTLDQVRLQWRPQAAVTVVMAAGGYPDDYATGQPITGIQNAEAQSCLVFHAGTKLVDDEVVTAGGRVLNVTALGDSVTAAAEQAYRGIQAIHFSGAHYRRDIGRV
jgi:phosphoribosylamine--glycine ligase